MREYIDKPHTHVEIRNNMNEYIDKQHAKIRKLLLIVLFIITVSIGTITYLVLKLNAMQKIIDTCK